MKLFIVIVCWVLFITSCCIYDIYAGHNSIFANTRHHTEKYYQELIQEKIGGKLESVLDDGTRIDIETEKEVVEVEFAYKWYESIGQSAHYSFKTGKEPVVWLIKEGDEDEKYIGRCKRLCDKGIEVILPQGHIKIKVFVYE